jgi:hypothetical protein
MLIEFEGFPEHRELVGNLLIAYGEIEWAVAVCLQRVLDIKASHATRILFRVNGEGARLATADAIMRPCFAKVGLEGQWGCAIGAAKHCKNIRNQYAHCHWRLIQGVLRFVDLDREAKAVDGPLIVDAIPLNLDLLREQRKYFLFALDWLYFLDEEYQKRAGRLSSHSLAIPKAMPEPPLYKRPDQEAQNQPPPS